MKKILKITLISVISLFLIKPAFAILTSTMPEQFKEEQTIQSSEPDFGPFMRDLQQRIKHNWNPPKGEENRCVVLLFKIARDGRLISVNVSKSSGSDVVDRAALAAVKMTAPFRPLPNGYSEDSVDIQFTFDYRIYGAKKY